MHRLLDGPGDRYRAPARAHDLDPRRPGLLAQPPQVPGHQGRDVGVHHGGGGALVLPVLPENARRYRQGDARLCESRGQRLFVTGIGVGVEQHDGHGVGAPDPLPECPYLLGVQHFDHLALGVHASGDAHSVLPGHQRGRAMPHQSVELGPVLTTDLDDVLESTVGDQHHPGALPFQEGVGGHRGAVKEEVGVSVVHQLPNSVQDRVRGIRRGGWGLQRLEPAFPKEEQVGEGPPGVHRQDRC